MRLMMIRHGETVIGSNKYLGSTDAALSDEGRADIRLRANRGEYEEADIVFASPLTRCRETAAIIYPGAELHLIDEYRECDFGLWEAKSYREILADPSLGDDYQRWIDSGGEAPIPGGEDKASFIQRVGRGYEKMLEILAQNNHPHRVAMIVHCGTIGAVICYLAGDPAKFYDYKVSYGESMIIEISSEGCLC